MAPSRTSLALSKRALAHADARWCLPERTPSPQTSDTDVGGLATVLRATARAAHALAYGDCAIAAVEVHDRGRRRFVVEQVGPSLPFPEWLIRDAVSTAQSHAISSLDTKRERVDFLQGLATMGFRSVAAAALSVGGMLGCVMVASTTAHTLSSAAAELEGIARYAVLFLEEVSAEIRSIARELHDTLGHTLTCLVMTSDELAHRRLQGERLRLAQALRSYGLKAMADVRALIDLTVTGRRVDRDPERVIAESLRRLSALGVETRYSNSVDFRMLPSRAALCVGAVAAESLMNVLRHAHARSVHVSVGCDGREMELIITDDGAGFAEGQMARDSPGFGVRSMRKRVEEIRGALTIQSTPGEGTTVSVRLPVA